MILGPGISRLFVIIWNMVSASFLAAAALASGDAPVHGAASAQTDSHAHHHMGMSVSVQRSEAQYTVPDVKLVRDDGKSVSLTALTSSLTAQANTW